MAMDLKEIEKHIKEALPDALVEIQDLAGDGNHYSATITSSVWRYVRRTQPPMRLDYPCTNCSSEPTLTE